MKESKTRAEQAEELKIKGNDCMKAGNYSEALLHYSHALKLDPKMHQVYSNRSLAFLKLEQFHFALEDAHETIKLMPQWPKGYFRKGEVLFHAKHFKEALFSYRQGYIMAPDDDVLRGACRKAEQEISKKKKFEARLPYLGIGAGLVFGLLIVLADHYATKEPTLQYAVIKFLLIGVFGLLGYGIVRLYKYYIDLQIESLLQPPIDLLKEINPDSGNSVDRKPQEDRTETKPAHEASNVRRKGGANIAKQRFKKGKS